MTNGTKNLPSHVLCGWMNEYPGMGVGRGKRMKWLYSCICNAINVHHEPWTCTIIRSSLPSKRRKPLFPCCCSSTTFYNFLILFRSEQIAPFTERNYFLIYFHFILLRWFVGEQQRRLFTMSLWFIQILVDYASSNLALMLSDETKNPSEFTPCALNECQKQPRLPCPMTFRFSAMVLTQKLSNMPKIIRVEKRYVCGLFSRRRMWVENECERKAN